MFTKCSISFVQPEKSRTVNCDFLFFRCPKSKLEHSLNLNMDRRSAASPVQSSIQEAISEEELGDEIVIKEQDKQQQQQRIQHQQRSSHEGEQQCQQQQCPVTGSVADKTESTEPVFTFIHMFQLHQSLSQIRCQVRFAIRQNLGYKTLQLIFFASIIPDM